MSPRATTPPTYPSGRWTAQAQCPECQAKPLPLGGPEGGALVHIPTCTKAR
ncbi:hypothetical protein ACFYNM_23035 [Streptomyces spororaveus]|uniref:hypothetical protein n=1 Tax=Streptomyces spororaveus TaxID=284039 RepID=UPI0036ACE908